MSVSWIGRRVSVAEVFSGRWIGLMKLWIAAAALMLVGCAKTEPPENGQDGIDRSGERSDVQPADLMQPPRVLSPEEQKRLDALLAVYRRGRDAKTGSRGDTITEYYELTRRRRLAEEALKAEFPYEFQMEKRAEDERRKQEAKGEADALVAEELGRN